MYLSTNLANLKYSAVAGSVSKYYSVIKLGSFNLRGAVIYEPALISKEIVIIII